MINISNIADYLEQTEIPDEMERLSKLLQAIYFNKFDSLGEVRDVFDATSIEDLMKLFKVLKEENSLSFDDEDYETKTLGETVASSVFKNSYWNVTSCYYYWYKLQGKKKTFI